MRPFGFGNQVLIPRHGKLLSSKATAVSVAETPGQRCWQARLREASSGAARWTTDTSPLFLTFDMAARLFSPYDLNRKGQIPSLRFWPKASTLGSFVKLHPAFHHSSQRAGRARPDLSPQVLLASACLPTMFQALEIDGEPYWDGGYSGNPTMPPLVRECMSRDRSMRSSVQARRVRRVRGRGYPVGDQASKGCASQRL